MRRRPWSLLFLLSFSFSVQGQEQVQSTEFIAIGETNRLDFVVIDGNTYISLDDLNDALPGWFEITSNGQLRTSQFLMQMLASGIGNVTSPTATPPSTRGSVIESRIEGEFNGWDGETIFRLTNGQIWQQDEYDYHYSYRYRPEVMIVETRRGWMMSVDGVNDQIRVRRLR